MVLMNRQAMREQQQTVKVSFAMLQTTVMSAIMPPPAELEGLYHTALISADALLQDGSPIAAIPRYALFVDDVLLKLKAWKSTNLFDEEDTLSMKSCLAEMVNTLQVATSNAPLLQGQESWQVYTCKIV